MSTGDIPPLDEAVAEYSDARTRLREVVDGCRLSRVEHRALDEVLTDVDLAVAAIRHHAEFAPTRGGREVWYMAHPVAGDVAANLERAERWLAWLMRMNPDAAIVAPWIAGCRIGDDADPAQRERGLLDCEAVAARCNGIVLVGGRVSTGMRREVRAARAGGRRVVDLSELGAEPPTGRLGVPMLVDLGHRTAAAPMPESDLMPEDPRR